MSLQVWLPFNGNLNNQGLSDVVVTNRGATVDSNGKIGSCYSFDGGTDRVSISDPLPFTEDLTIAAWIKPTNVSSTTTQYALSYNTDTGGTSGHLLGIGMYGSSALAVWCSGTVFTTSVTLVDNTWYHVTASRARTGELKVYVNGSCILTSADSNAPASRWFTIGGRSNSATGGAGGVGYCFKGSINDVRLYNHCLSAKEVKEISKGLVCHYKLDNNGFGNPNLITTMTPGNRMTLSGRYGLGADFSQNADTYGYFNVSPALELGSTYTLSFDVSNFPVGSTWNFKLWNNVNYDIGTITKDGHYNYTFVPSESKLPSGYNLTKFLFDDGGRTNPIGMVYFTNFKIEKGNKSTPWCPHTSDSLYASLGLNSTTESDCSGNSYNGTLSESLPYAPDSPRYDGCYYFNSNSKRITLPAINMSGFSNSFSIAWWGKAPSYSSLMYWGFSNGNRLNYFAGRYCNTEDGFSNPYYKPNTTTTISVPSVDAWHHFVMVGDGSSNKLYMDGELYGVAATYKGITGSTIVINGWDSSADYKTNGYISDFRIYSTALSASDVKELYNTSASVDKNGNMYAYEFKEE